MGEEEKEGVHCSRFSFKQTGINNEFIVFMNKCKEKIGIKFAGTVLEIQRL